jgi:hypothetical protein
MKITKKNILQAIKEVKKEEKRIINKPFHHCDICFINPLLKIATFDEGESRGCMVVLNEINRVFGTTYHIYKPFCEYGEAVPYEPISKRFRRVIPI